jgi:hypothetical protein
MAGDNLDGPELDVLIRDLSAPKKKVVVATPAVSRPAAPIMVSSVVRPAGSGMTAPPVAPRREQKSFLSSIRVPKLPALPALRLPALPALPALSLPRLNQIRVPQSVVVRSCVALGVLLSAAMPFWPYPKAGVWWVLYLFSVGMVVVAGVWSARLTWNTRLGMAHTVALFVVLWGITLAAEEALAMNVLPPVS